MKIFAQAQAQLDAFNGPWKEKKASQVVLFSITGSDTTPRGGCEGHSSHGQTLAGPQRESEAEGQGRRQHPADSCSRLREALNGTVLLRGPLNASN